MLALACPHTVSHLEPPLEELLVSRKYRLLPLLIVAAVAFSAWPAALSSAPVGRGVRATPAEVAGLAVLGFFKKLPDFEDRDLISRSQAKAMFDELARRGWKIPRSDELVEKVLPDDDSLVKDLRTAKGRRFMRKVSRYSSAYDRLDRLDKLPGGRQTVKSLIDDPDGHKMLEYLTSTSGGTELGKMLAKSPRGADFNKPTGRIYTSPMLAGQVQRLVEEAGAGR